MTIEIRLFATLAEFLPAGSRFGTVTLDVPEASRVADVIESLGIPPTLPCIALVNGEDTDTDRALSAGDIVTLFPPLAGG